MSLRAPFLVKQYLSNDVESGSYSRIFWYYPLDQVKADHGGIGLFFEVISGDIADEIYEQITKRFWESFCDNFYTEGFEPALKKSIKMFIQLLRNFNVEEGIDVNIVLLNVVAGVKGYTLKLISFGDSDIFVVRDEKFADMAKMVPVNGSLYDLKFLEVELDRGDVLMLGNKTLLRNAFESDMLALDGVENLLRSLEVFKENLFGSKKLFLVAATDEDEQEKKEDRFAGVKAAGGKAVDLAKKGFAALTLKVGELYERIRKPKKKTESIIPETLELEKKEESLPVENEELPELSDIPEEGPEIVENKRFEENLPEEEPKKGYIEPPPVVSDGEEIEEMSDITEEKPTDEEHIVEPVSTLPGRTVTVDDFVVAEEITPSMVVEKSTYQELVDEAESEGSKGPVQPTHVAPPQGFVATTRPVQRGQNYVSELKMRHSTFGKIIKHPIFKQIGALITAGFQFVYAQIMKLFGKTPQAVGNKSLFLTRPTVLEKKKVQPGMVLIFAIVILVAFFWIRGAINQGKIEKAALADYQQSVAAFSTFYDRNIAVIDTEDPDRQLELCAPEVTKVTAKQQEVTKKIKSKKNVEAMNVLVSQVQSKAVECQTKYDKVYGIIRVKDAELITDFKVSLGNDSDISAISLRQGAIVVADKGRKAVYQLNVDTRSITKLEDPLGLVVDPVTVGTGEGTLFVCDRTNGVLYYSPNASGNREGFNRVVGAEPTSIGECAIVEGYAKNAYIVPTTANVVYKIVGNKTGTSFGQPSRYIKDLLGVRSLAIDGHIYVVTTVNGKGDVARYFGGKLDNFTIPESANLGDLTASYTNPSAERNIYVYDKTKNAVISIEKPTSKHPGRGVVERTYLFENADKFKDVKSIAVDLNVRNQEVNMYVLAGTSIWRVKL